MKLFVFTALLIVAPTAHAQKAAGPPDKAPKAVKITDVALANGDFEMPMQGTQIPGWAMLQHAGDPAYEMVVDTRRPGQGAQSARITRTKEEWWGRLQQRIVAPHPGTTIEFSALLRTEDVGPLGWRMYVHFQDGSFAIREVQSDPMTGTQAKWRRVTIREVVPDQTRELVLGIALLDAGTGWIDDVRLRVIDDGTARPPPEKTHPMALPRVKSKTQAKP